MRAPSKLLVIGLLTAAACGGDDVPTDGGEGPADAGRADAGMDGGRDAGFDAGSGSDGGVDASEGFDAAMDAAMDDGSIASDGGADGGLDADGGTPALGRRQTVAAGNQHTCAIGASGGVFCWGFNDMGQLGIGTNANRTTPTEVVGLSGVVSITAGHSTTCAVLDTGAARCWGDNSGGQLGGGSAGGTSRSPAPVVGLTSVVEMQSFWTHTCARLAGGTVQCFGSNGGRYGDGTTAGGGVPVAMMGITDAVDVGVGWGHSCVALGTGGVRCAGTYNNWGQLGDGTTSTRTSPVDVLDLSNATSLGIGSYHSCAVTASNTVRCWGNNQTGALGVGTSGDAAHPSPEDVPGLTDVVQVRGGSAITCALHATGAVSCWGIGVGDGTSMTRRSPVAVPGITDAIEVEIGPNHTCVVLRDRHIRCWGSNGYGQLGDETTTTTALAPVAVAASPL